MKAFRLIIVILTFVSSSCFGQVINQKDSLRIIKTVYSIFDAIESGDETYFRKLSLPIVYCLPCMDFINGNNRKLYYRNEFYSKYLPDLIQFGWFKKAMESKAIFFDKKNVDASKLIVFFNINMNELDITEHNSFSIGIHLNRKENEYAFSGIETVP